MTLKSFPQHRGFTLIELMIVIAILGIMATMAVPTFQDRVLRSQVSEGMALAEFAKQAIAEHYSKTRRLPSSNEEAGLPPPDKIVGTYVQSVLVRDGALLITYGQQANRHLHGKTLSLRPATVPDYPKVPLAWVCGLAAVPQGMVTNNQAKSDLPPTAYPLDCRA
ncbi:MAG: pilin [Ideonella sp.]|nr:pilin [Ideonella sp.]